MKKILSLFLTTAMSLSMIAGSAFASDFTDIKDSDQYEAIEVLGTIGLVEGVSDGTFDPEGTLTRAELCTMMVRAICDKNEIFYNDTKVFDDVKYNHWARIYIETAVRNGIMNGCGNDEFRPDESLTYVEAARTVLNTLGYGKLDWPVGVNTVAYRLNLYENLPMIDYNTNCTRAHAAQMIYNAFNCELVNEYAGQHFGTGKYFLKNILNFEVETETDNYGRIFVTYKDDKNSYRTDLTKTEDKIIYPIEDKSDYCISDDTEKIKIDWNRINTYLNKEKITENQSISFIEAKKAVAIFDEGEIVSIIINNPIQKIYIPTDEEIPEKVKLDSNYRPYYSTVTYYNDNTYKISNKVEEGFIVDIISLKNNDYKVTLSNNFSAKINCNSNIKEGSFIRIFIDIDNEVRGYDIIRE